MPNKPTLLEKLTLEEKLILAKNRIGKWKCLDEILEGSKKTTGFQGELRPGTTFVVKRVVDSKYPNETVYFLKLSKGDVVLHDLQTYTHGLPKTEEYKKACAKEQTLNYEIRQLYYHAQKLSK